jgi:hypothetical protein
MKPGPLNDGTKRAEWIEATLFKMRCADRTVASANHHALRSIALYAVSRTAYIQSMSRTIFGEQDQNRLGNVN